MTRYHHQGRHGIEYINTPKAPEEKSTKCYRDFISRSFKEIDENYNISKIVQLVLQGQWTRRLSFMQQDFSWKSFLRSPVNHISFCLSSTFDTLPSQSNLKRWRISSEASCFLCNIIFCTTAHILGACGIALKQGHFTFRQCVVPYFCYPKKIHKQYSGSPTKTKTFD